MEKIGLKLNVTLRPNIKTSNNWQIIQLDDALDLIAGHPSLKKHYDHIHKTFIQIDGWVSSEGLDEVDDYLITPTMLDDPQKQSFVELKREHSQCINFFGSFVSPSNALELVGEGNGVVILDIDIKEFARNGPIHSAFLEKIESEVMQFYAKHESTLFLYQSASTKGFHMGFYTEARTPQDYKNTFKALLQELEEKVPILSEKGVIDTNCSNYNRAFFISHSPFVLRKTPNVKMPVPVVDESESFEIDKSVIDPVGERKQGAYTEFPFHEDFRLYLAFKSREKQAVYFDSFGDWMAMVYSLLNVYSLTFRDRLLYWFETLSQLSPKYDQERNMEILEKIISKGDIKKEAGIEYLLFRLNGSQSVSSRPEYTIKDIEGYFDVLGEGDKPDQEFSDIFYINKHLTELKIQIDFQEKKNYVVESPPGSGKSTFFLEHMEGKRIFLVPFLILLEDLKKKVPADKLQIVNQDVKSEDIDPTKEIILAAFESLPKIIQSGIRLNDYTLIVDEGHNLFTSAAPFFRFQTMNLIVRSLPLFRNFIMLSGTWIPFTFTQLPYTFIKVQYKNPAKTQLELVQTPTPLDTLTKDVVKEKGKQVILINNKIENNRLKEDILLNRPCTPIRIVNSSTKNEEEVRNLMSINQMEQGEVMIGTQMIAEGISLLDKDITSVRFYMLMYPELIAQYCFRIRSQGSKPIVSFYHKRETFTLFGLDYGKEYKKTVNRVKLKEPNEMASEYINPKTGLMIYYSLDAKKKDKKEYSPYVREQGNVKLNDLLLGYQTLQGIVPLMHLDFFSLLSALRKWGFSFLFSSQEGSIERKNFKNLRQEQHIEIIKTDLASLTNEHYTSVTFLPNTPLQKAWVALQAVNVGYFQLMDTPSLISLFTNKKQYKVFLERVAGVMLLQDKINTVIYEQLDKNYKAQNAQVFSRISKVSGYPNKIFHNDLKESFADLNISIQKLKNILSMHFEVSQSKAGSSEKYFGIEVRSDDVEQFIKWDTLLSYQNDPFI